MVALLPRLLVLVASLLLFFYLLLSHLMGDSTEPPLHSRREGPDTASHSRSHSTGGRADRIPGDPSNYVEPVKSKVLFFNRVPKTGSEMLVLLLSWLQRRNGFTHVRLKNTVKRHLDRDEQVSLVSEIVKHLRSSSTPLVSFDRHVHFTNFSEFGLDDVSSINVLREPIEKLTSRFYYARATPRPGGYTPSWSVTDALREVPPYSSLEECVASGHEQCTYSTGRHYDLTIPYFCGHHDYCRELGNVGALETAKRNLEQHFPVVGVLEELNATLTVLEHRLPQFFMGVTSLYYEDLGAPHLNKNYHRPPSLSPETDAALRRNLSLEVAFYHHARTRLLHQLRAVTAI